MSSPPAAAPQLHAEIFSSPIRQQYSRPTAPRTPGVSVQPVKNKAKDAVLKPPKKDEISWESDSDEDAEGVYRELGMSPPKTIQFSLPQSRLLQTPGQHSSSGIMLHRWQNVAREASKRIVEDLLTTAGAGLDDTDSLDDSPSVVAMKDNLDDSF
jgi:DASH complex subunit ASK1